MDSTNFVEAFDKFLQYKKMTIADYARAAGVTYKHIWCTIHNKSVMQFRFLKKLEQISGIEGSFWIKLYYDTYWDEIQ